MAVPMAVPSGIQKKNERHPNVSVRRITTSIGMKSRAPARTPTKIDVSMIRRTDSGEATTREIRQRWQK
jgi:hypothetical protein